MRTRFRTLLSPPGSWRREAAVVATTFALGVLGGVPQVDETRAAPSLAAYLIAAGSSAVLPLRHRAPVVALALTTGFAMCVAPAGLVLTQLLVAPALVCAYAVGMRSEPRLTAAVLAPVAGLLVAFTPVFEPDLTWEDASRLVTVAASPWLAALLGRSAHNRRAYLGAVEERAERAEESRDSEARRRVDEERVRIARELHDLVAHQITLAHAQASVAAHVFDSRPEEARRNLRELVRTTSNALDDLRATVGLLRQTGDAAGSVEPAPGLSRLSTLLAAFGRAGLDVSFDQDGQARTLPPGVDLTAYRIIQEALTNVTKHAGSGTARVALTWHRDRVTITVADDGGGDRRTTVGAGDTPSGYGLIGMSERATAVGGHVAAGGRPEGGFLVSADLPILRHTDEPTTAGVGGDVA